MKRYDFDQKIDRHGTACVKHDGVYGIFGIERKEACDGAETLPMWVADMDFPAPDFVLDAIARRNAHPVLGYTYGDEAYLGAVRWWLAHRYGIQADDGELHFIPGIVAGIAFAIQAFTNPGDGILVTTPVYPPFLTLPEGSGRRLVRCPLKVENGRFTIDFDRFRDMAHGCKMFILSNPHNPGGTVWTKDELLAIAEICEREGIIVISDEIHADLTLPGHRHTSYSTVSEVAARHSLTFMAPSKTFNIAGLSSSVCYCPDPKLRKRFFEGYLDTFGVAGGTVFAYTATAAAFTPEGEEWLGQLLAYLNGNIDHMRSFLAANMPHLDVLYPEASFLAWMDFGRYGLGHDELRHRLFDKARVILNDGFDFGGEAYSTCFRLNFGCPRSTLDEALRRIATVMDSPVM